MKGKVFLVVTSLLLMAGVALGDSWTMSTHYLRLNQASPSGNADNFGIGVSYDWMLDQNTTFPVEGIGSWDNDANIYGGGFNMKMHLGSMGETNMYAGAYADLLCASNLYTETGNKCGLMWGPLIGMKMPMQENVSLFCQYQYGWIDGGTLRDAFDEAQMVVVGLEMPF